MWYVEGGEGGKRVVEGWSKFSVGTLNEKRGGQTSNDEGERMFVLNISFSGEEALLMFIILLYSNAKHQFLKLKLVMYIEIIYFSMKISGWNLSN